MNSNDAGNSVGGSVTRPPTFGEKAVGMSFNPGGDPQVTKIKALYASIIDELNDMRDVGTPSSAQMRHIACAITDAETAQMRAVKAITWQE